MNVNYNFYTVVSGIVTFTYSNLINQPILPVVGGRIKVTDPINLVVWDYTVDSIIVFSTILNNIMYSTVQLNCHITII